MWVENLCDEMLDCSSCPCALDSRFNVSSLHGKIPIHDMQSCEEVFMIGFNRLARTFGHTGLVGLASRHFNHILDLVSAPGQFQKQYRLGELRDAKPRGGDAGIPFPRTSVCSRHKSLSFSMKLLKTVPDLSARTRRYVLWSLQLRQTHGDQPCVDIGNHWQHP